MEYIFGAARTAFSSVYINHSSSFPSEGTFYLSGVGRIIKPSKDVHFITPEICKWICHLCDKRDLSDVIKLRTLRWRDDLGLSKWAQLLKTGESSFGWRITPIHTSSPSCLIPDLPLCGEGHSILATCCSGSRTDRILSLGRKRSHYSLSPNSRP